MISAPMSMNSLILRALAALLFIFGGGYLVLLAALGIPDFWYIPCLCALVPIGVVWAWKPAIAAPLSVGPLAAVVAALCYQSGVKLALWAACLVAAVTLVFVMLRRSRRWKVLWRFLFAS
jgi:hypothetical protein